MRMIGNSFERNGPYYLEYWFSFKTDITTSSTFSSSEVMLWHKHLGHTSFPYLKYLYPCLFINKDSSSFKCVHCIYAK